MVDAVPDFTLEAPDVSSLSMLPFDIFPDGEDRFLDSHMFALPANSIQLAGLTLDVDLTASLGQTPAGRTSITDQGLSTWNQNHLSTTPLTPGIPQAPRWTEGPDANLALIESCVCVQAEMDNIKGNPSIEAFPTGLMFSLLCLGTSVCWLDARLLGLPFLKEAKALLGRLSDQCLDTRDDAAQDFLFFRNSLVYWEMLLAVVNGGDIAGGTDELVSRERNKSETMTDLLPHPWTGISSMTARLFSRSVTLCRAYRRILTRPTGRVIALSAAMEAFQGAQKLEEQLLSLDYSSVSRMNDTGDQKTPWLHLACAAEAYQLSALLQLYITFPDLVSMRLQLASALPDEDHASWDKLITPLACDLVKVLKKIPPDSGSRVIQPILYICASTGLRYGRLDTPAPSAPHRLETGIPNGAAYLDCINSNILDYVDGIVATSDKQTDSSRVPLEDAGIGASREFIMKRLDILENTLQPRPIRVAKDLVKAIWTAYDGELPGCISVHWFDVMEAHDLRSLFG
ncbi:hypothetical protein MAA_01292 [Metarhizium robertsii ARSEF 23]|uniref:Fungal specific transcription factor domain protein n=1 Tax=Metarhizium robertsii (strain ARSEF 23 / ATCC MYA-3075) TaxID=655844 RepID=E9ENK6_METRA|nr:uncharacterized protein MAA_01292 [Metarhizium robertsii ARSEF 23]EFZ04218.2 hypothetical protein MAA_01292 [Metarhizium robertsii ARSEF 23]